MSRRKRKKKSPVAAVCSALGTVLLIILVVACLPLTLPKVFGYHIYTVISGSMEPEIPIGSLVYVKNLPPEEVQADEIIAFYGAMDDGAIITHRVVSNSKIMGEFITKGDANKTKDMNPIPYNNYIGKMVLSIPKAGGMVQTLATMQGKIAAALVIGLAMLLELIAILLRRREE